MSATNPKVRTAKDNLSFKRLGLIGLVAIVIGGLAVAWSSWILQRNQKPIPEGTELTQTAPWEVGVVKQTPIRTDRFGLREQVEQRARLDEWAWVDRDRGIARIPIEEAMRVTAATDGAPPIAADAAPAAAPAPQEGTP